jgi:hypothetical protein
MAAAAAAELQALQGAVAAGDLAKASALLSSLKARALRRHARALGWCQLRTATPAGGAAAGDTDAHVLYGRASAGQAHRVCVAAAAAGAVAQRRRGAGARTCVPGWARAAPAAAQIGVLTPARFTFTRRGLFAGSVFESAVFLSVKAKDEAAFERNFAQLKPYYTDARCGAAHARDAPPAAPSRRASDATPQP